MRGLWIPVPRSGTLVVFTGMTMIFLAGCQSTPKQETNTTVMVGGSQVDLKALAAQVQKDPQARSAVTAVNSSFGMQGAGIKYCPVDGKHYSGNLEYCPVHKVKLVPVEE